MSILNPILCGIVSLLLIAVILVSIRMTRAGMRNQASVMASTEELTSSMHETLAAHRTLATFNAGAQQNARVAVLSGEHAAELESAGELRAVITPFFGFAEYSGILIILLVGGWFTLHGGLTAGGLVAFLAYMEMAAEPMSRCAQMLPRMQKAIVAADRLTELLDLSGGKVEDGGHAPALIQGRVRFESVTFKYARTSRPALNQIKVDVRPGERIAVVGANAAGKSTLLDLMLKLQAPDVGRIMIDDYDLRDLSTIAWRRVVGIMPQDCVLLHRSIAENISLGDANLNDVRTAARLAGVDERINSLSHGYDTCPGERGAHLSGGERQRIALARLFFRNPRIVLLDEPTSALDMHSESEILPALDRLCEGRTTFIVSHRTRILRNVDRVLLLSDGEVLCFDCPANVWERFPSSRSLFPAEWGELKVAFR